MSRNDSEPASGSSPSKIAKPNLVKPVKRPLTPDHKQSALPKPGNRNRSASADSKSQSWRQRGVNVSKTSLASKGMKQVSKPSGVMQQREPGDNASCTKGSTHHDVAKTEFAESSFVYFSCHEEPPVDNEQQAWVKNERVQVARFVRSLPSGDCLVQLLKADVTYSQATTSALGFKAYVSTPHFIECCGSQLHNIQSMRFDAAMGKWKWFCQQKTEGDDGSGSSGLWKRDLAIDIAPSAYTLPAGPKTEPALKSRSLIPTFAMAKKTSQNAHFFTEVLSRVKCNSISLEEPVVVCATEGREPDATPCPEFVQNLYATISFESPVAPTVFPKVQVELPLSIPKKKLVKSPPCKKLNASALEVM